MIDFDFDQAFWVLEEGSKTKQRTEKQDSI